MTDESEIISMQVVTFECGICQKEYGIELYIDDVYMVACPFCENASLQMVRGTE